MTLTTTDIKKVREIVREETADIVHKIDYLQNEVTDIKENMLTKKDATTLMSDTANLVIKNMQDQFRVFADKTMFLEEK